VQNYSKSISEPTLILTIEGVHQKFQQKDLATLPRTSRDVAGQNWGSCRTYVGVLLSGLLPTHTLISRYEIYHGFFHTRRLDASLFEPGTDLLVADGIEHQHVDRGSLFYVVGVLKDGQPFVIRKVTSIELGAERDRGE
jgi:hypothetical protein